MDKQWETDLMDRHRKVNDSVEDYFAREAAGTLDKIPSREPDEMLLVKWSDRVTEYDGWADFDGYGHFDLQTRFLPNDIIRSIVDVLKPVMGDSDGVRDLR